MTQTLDVNVLVYATHEESPFHAKARALVAALSAGPELVYLFWPVLLGYLRVATYPGLLQPPVPAAVARANIEALIARPHVRLVSEQEGFWQVFDRVAGTTGVRGRLVPDAHLVALMVQHGVSTIWTHDRDFRRFDGITVRDPFA